GAAVVDLQAVVQWRLGTLDHAFKDAPGVDLLELDRRLVVVEQHPDLARGRAQRADGQAAGAGMRAQNRMRAGVLATHEQIEFLSRDAHSCSFSARFAPAKPAL